MTAAYRGAQVRGADEPSVPTRTWLRPSTWRALEQHASELGITVSEIASRVLDQAVKPKTTPRRSTTRMTPGLLAQAVERRAAGESVATIARRMGVSRSSLYNHLNERHDS